jgi:uncharacterized membrane protein
MKRAIPSAALAASVLAASASPSLALTIVGNYDDSITSLANASTVEAAFAQAGSNIGAMFSDPVTVNINVSWGSVAGQSLPSSSLGSSSTSLYGYYSYPQIKSMLTQAATTAADRSAIATLPASAPAGQSRYAITAAQAKALGVVSPTGGVDGSIGFGSNNYTFGQSAAPGTYDFVGVAEHEITEVMGRISGLSSTSPSFATAEDLFRFSGTGVPSWDYNGSSYFSIDNGATDLANFNSSGGGDRGDWLSTSSTNDVADAFTFPGVTGVLSNIDQTALDVIGWGGNGSGYGSGVAVATTKGAASVDVPEPASLALLAAGALAAARLRRRVRTQDPV